METRSLDTVFLVKSPRRTVGVDLEERPDGIYSSGFSRHFMWGIMELWRGPYPSEESAVRNALCFLRDYLRHRGVIEDVFEIGAYLARIPTVQAEFGFCRRPSFRPGRRHRETSAVNLA